MLFRSVKVEEAEIEQYLDQVYKKLEWLSTEDLIKRVVSLEFNRMLQYYKDSADLDIPEEGRRSREGMSDDRGRNRKRSAEDGFSRIFINLGKTDSIYPKELIDVINKSTKRRIDVGRIDVLQNFSFFEVPEKEAHTVLADLNGYEFNGREISVEIAKDEKRSGGRDGRRGGSRGDSSRRGPSRDRGGFSGERRGGDSRPRRDRDGGEGGYSRPRRDRDASGVRTERRRR